MKNQDWEKYNNCSNCEYRTPCTTDHCRIVGGKPKQKCQFFKGVVNESKSKGEG